MEESPEASSTMNEDSVKLTNGDVNNVASTSSRISTLDQCYEAVKEKLERLREEIRRIRINKQQEQIQQSIQHAKRLSVDSNSGSSSSGVAAAITANVHLLVPPSLPGSVMPRVSPLHSPNNNNRIRHRAHVAATKSLENSSLNNTAVSNGNGDESKKNDETKAENGRKEGSQSPIWVLHHEEQTPVNLPNNRHRSLNNTRIISSSPEKNVVLGPSMSRMRSKTLHESPHPVRLQQNNHPTTNEYSGVENSDKKLQLPTNSIVDKDLQKTPTFDDSSVKNQQPDIKKGEDTLRASKNDEFNRQRVSNLKAIFGPATSPGTTVRPMLGAIKAVDFAEKRSRQSGEVTPTRQNPAPVSESNNDKQFSSQSRSRTGSFAHHQQQSAPPLVLSTVVLPQHTSSVAVAQQQQQQVQQPQQQRRPPRSFTVRTNATPECELDEPVQKATLSVPTNGHHVAMAQSPSSQNKCLVVPSSTNHNVNVSIDATRSASRSTSGSSSHKSLTPSVSLFNKTSNQQKIDMPQTRQEFLIDSKSPSFSAPVDPPPQFLVGGKAVKASPQIANNKPAFVGVPNGLLSTDSSSYENLDQTSSSHGRSAGSTSSSGVSTAVSTIPPFPVPVGLVKGKNDNTLVNLANGKQKTPPPAPQPPLLLAPNHQRKSAVLASELEIANQNKQIRARVFPFQRNSLEIVSPPSYQDTDSELEGIFGECEAFDDFETSTTMSDSPSLLSDVSLWPVMIGNNVVATKRRPRTVGQQYLAKKKPDPPRVADALMAAQIANRRGSLARPRPTTATSYYIGPNNRSVVDLNSSGSSSVPAANHVNQNPAPPAPAVTLPTPEQQRYHQRLQQTASSSALQQKPTVVNSPRIAPITLAALHQQRRLQQQQRPILGTGATANMQVPLLAPPPVTSNGTSPATQTQQSSSGNGNKPSVTGLLYGTDAANRANQHLREYAFRGGEPPQQNRNNSQQLLSRSVNSSSQPSSSLLKQEIRPLVIGGTLSINNAAPRNGSTTVTVNNGSNSNGAAGQVSVASVIFNNPLHQQPDVTLNRHNTTKPHNSSKAPSNGTSEKNDSGGNSHHHHHHRRRGTLPGPPVEVYAASAAMATNPQRHSQVVTT